MGQTARVSPAIRRIPRKRGTGEHQRAQFSSPFGLLRVGQRRGGVLPFNGRSRPVNAQADVIPGNDLQHVVQRQKAFARRNAGHGIAMFQHQIAGPVPWR